MSVIAVKKTKDQIIIGSDQQITRWYDEKHTSIHPCKLHKCWDLVFWSAGDLANIWPMKIFLETYEPKKLNSPKEIFEMMKQFKERGKDYNIGDDFMKENDFIFVSNWKIFSYCSWCVEEVNDYRAIGSGAMKAMACMFLWSTVEACLKAVCKYDLHCSEPLVLIEIPLHTK